MRSRLLYLGLVACGALVGAAAMAALLNWSMLSVDYKMPVVELAQLAATVVLAIYIPLALERALDSHRGIRSLLVADVESLAAVVRRVNETMSSCAKSNVTTESDRMTVRTSFMTANLRLSALSTRLRTSCGNDCASQVELLRHSYEKYYRAVTEGALYTTQVVDWGLWRRQELPFAAFETAKTSLEHYLTAR